MSSAKRPVADNSAAARGESTQEIYSLLADVTGKGAMTWASVRE